MKLLRAAGPRTYLNAIVLLLAFSFGSLGVAQSYNPHQDADESSLQSENKIEIQTSRSTSKSCQLLFQNWYQCGNAGDSLVQFNFKDDFAEEILIKSNGTSRIPIKTIIYREDYLDFDNSTASESGLSAEIQKNQSLIERFQNQILISNQEPELKRRIQNILSKLMKAQSNLLNQIRNDRKINLATDLGEFICLRAGTNKCALYRCENQNSKSTKSYAGYFENINPNQDQISYELLVAMGDLIPKSIKLFAVKSENSSEFNSPEGYPLYFSSSKLLPKKYREFEAGWNYLLNPRRIKNFDKQKNNCDPVQVAEMEKQISTHFRNLSLASDGLSLIQVIQDGTSEAQSWLVNSERKDEINSAHVIAEEQKQFPNFQGRLLSPEELNSVFNKAKSMTDLKWDQSSDGCQARAHLLSYRLAMAGIATGKVWIHDNSLAAKNLIAKGIKNIWRMHVASLVFIKDKHNKSIPMVIDPATQSSAVTLDQFTKELQPPRHDKVFMGSWPPIQNLDNLGYTIVTISEKEFYTDKDQAPISNDEYLNSLETAKIFLKNYGSANSEKIKK